MSATVRICPLGCHTAGVGEYGRACATTCKMAKSKNVDGWSHYEPSPDCRLLNGPIPPRKATAGDAWGEP